MFYPRDELVKHFSLLKVATPITQWNDPDEAFTNIAQGIRKAVAELQQRKISQSTG